MKTKPRISTRKVKAWAILDDSLKRIVAVEPQSSRPTNYSIGTWGFPLGQYDSRAVPCTITYKLPPKPKKKV